MGFCQRKPCCRTIRVVSHGSPAALLQSTAQTLQGLGPVNRYPHPSNFKHHVLLVLVHFLPPCSCPCSQLLCPGSPLHMAPLRLPKSSSRLAVLVKIKAGTGTALRLISINFSSLDICPGNSHSYQLQKLRFLTLIDCKNLDFCPSSLFIILGHSLILILFSSRSSSCIAGGLVSSSKEPLVFFWIR